VLRVLVFVALASGMVSCAGSPSAAAIGPSLTGGGFVILIQNFTFVPPSLTVPPAAKITVVNHDDVTQTLTAVNRTFDTGDIPGGHTATFTAPTRPGSYPYICRTHPVMHGAIIVQ